MPSNSTKAAATLAAKRAAEKAAEEKKPMWTTKESGPIPEDEKKIRGLATAKEAAKNNLIKSGFAGAGAAIAQASRVGRNNLRRAAR